MDWFNCFQQDDCILTLKGKTYNKSDCLFLAMGSQKRVFQLKGTGQCFFIPSKYSGEEDWNGLIKAEKERLDYIISLGLKAQKFEITELIVANKTGDSYSMNILLTQDFETLVKEESLIIYNPKPGSHPFNIVPTVWGKVRPFYPLKACLEDPHFVRKMLSKIINELVIAATFSIPMPSLGSMVDDGVHYCFELSEIRNEPPIIRYMFWDMGRFDRYAEPCVPTFEALKKLVPELAREVALAINAVASEEIKERMKPGDFFLSSQHRFTHEIQKLIELALMSDEFLEGALEVARKGIKGELDLVMLLSNRPANFKGKDVQDEVALHHVTINDNLGLELPSFDMNTQAENGTTALHCAARVGDDAEIAKLLLNSGAAMNARDEEGNTPLHCAINFRNPDLKTVEILIEGGANLNAKNNKGCTALHLAVRNKNVKMVNLLVEKLADINVKDNKGRTPRDLAVPNKAIDKFLSRKGGVLTGKAEKDHTAFFGNATTADLEMLLSQLSPVQIQALENRLKL
ncbi:MAG: hypothetical protein K0R48_1012 [Gammaproteobacteria bacterium]|jgi:hypothetical protein|nr:hypothetical protein [Gammaproteobacteria bacterium]